MATKKVSAKPAGVKVMKVWTKSSMRGAANGLAVAAAELASLMETAKEHGGPYSYTYRRLVDAHAAVVKARDTFKALGKEKGY